MGGIGVPLRMYPYLGRYASDEEVNTLIAEYRIGTGERRTGSPQEGMWYFNTTDHRPRMYAGAAWSEWPTGGGSGVQSYTYAGNPNGHLDGEINDVCYDTDNGIYYVNETGTNDGWCVH